MSGTTHDSNGDVFGDLEVSPPVSECTPELRWVPRSMLQAGDYTLQQKWKVTYGPGRLSYEWRDVPRENYPNPSRWEHPTP